MDSYLLDKWEKLQSVDMSVRELQLAFDTIKHFDDCIDIIVYNNELEALRSTIHSKMKEFEHCT